MRSENFTCDERSTVQIATGPEKSVYANEVGAAKRAHQYKSKISRVENYFLIKSNQTSSQLTYYNHGGHYISSVWPS